jgi:hypothetical protein
VILLAWPHPLHKLVEIVLLMGRQHADTLQLCHSFLLHLHRFLTLGLRVFARCFA